MKIHTVRKGESPKSIAAQYDLCEDYLRRSNELECERCCVGEELLILQPTRTHRIARAETVERLAMRFGTKAYDVYTKNPWIHERGLQIGDTVALKYSDKKLGGAVANGFFYKGCTKEKLYRTLPYLTYVTFSSAISDERGTAITLDTAELVKEVKKNGKTALLRAYDLSAERYKNKADHNRYAQSLISSALAGGYDGITLNAFAYGRVLEYIDFISELKREMIGKNLILILEIGADAPKELCDMADGCILSCTDYMGDGERGFDGGVRKEIKDFAMREHRIKSFIELPCFSLSEKEYIPINEALGIARRAGCEIEENERTLTLEFKDERNRKTIIPSLKSTKAILDTVHEYDFMGICFDIMRTPLNRLMMYDAQFSTVYPTTVRSREGCSRGF